MGKPNKSQGSSTCPIVAADGLGGRRGELRSRMGAVSPQMRRARDHSVPECCERTLPSGRIPRCDFAMALGGHSAPQGAACCNTGGEIPQSFQPPLRVQVPPFAFVRSPRAKESARKPRPAAACGRGSPRKPPNRRPMQWAQLRRAKPSKRSPSRQTWRLRGVLLDLHRYAYPGTAGRRLVHGEVLHEDQL